MAEILRTNRRSLNRPFDDVPEGVLNVIDPAEGKYFSFERNGNDFLSRARLRMADQTFSSATA